MSDDEKALHIDKKWTAGERSTYYLGFVTGSGITALVGLLTYVASSVFNPPKKPTLTEALTVKAEEAQKAADGAKRSIAAWWKNLTANPK